MNTQYSRRIFKLQHCIYCFVFANSRSFILCMSVFPQNPIWECFTHKSEFACIVFTLGVPAPFPEAPLT